MKNIAFLPLGLVLLCGSVNAETFVKLGTHYPNHTVTEGYAGDIEQLQTDVRAGQPNPSDKTLVLTVSPDENRHSYHSADVMVSDVRSSVYSDNDHDGFFTRFTLKFDVDTHYGYEYVYARIYLSKDGTEYELFHVTEVFEIYSNYSSDRYIVDSKLVSNFDAAYYDVKIEIFVAGATGVQDVVDATTHRSLFALPLEADRLDGDSDAEIIVHEHAGSLSAPLLLLMGMLGLAVRLSRRKAC